MIDYRLALMAGTDIPIPECQIVLHQPTIKEIAMVGEKNFFTGISCLSIRKEGFIKDKSLLSQTSDFQIFMMVMEDESMSEKKQDTISVLTILFPRYKVIFTPRTIVLRDEDNKTHNIDDKNFKALQLIIEQVFCLVDTGQQYYNPANELARKIADKLMEGRRRVMAQNSAESNGASTFVQYLSILTVGLGSMSLQDCLNLTMYQMYDLVERYNLFVGWDIDLRARLAGAKPENQAEDWMKVIH